MKKAKVEHYYIVTIAGGLGSQMAKYAFYLLLNKKSPNTINMIDTYFYQYQEAWNGYELNKIFGIEAPDIVKLYREDAPIIHDYFKKAKSFLLQEQPNEEIIRVSRGEYTYYNSSLAGIKKLRDRVLFKFRYEFLTRFKTKQYGYVNDRYKRNWYRLKANVYYDEFNYTSDRYFREIKEEIMMTFRFPEFTDEKNRRCSQEMQNEESVMLHVRRSDHMYDNGFLYEKRYYQKAVGYIKGRVKQPSFYIFSDDQHWCRGNLSELGLNEKDKVVFVDWNRDEESYRDMQLMTYAKHDILAISSFSWWGYFLSKREGKIVCAPKGFWNEADKHF